MPGRVSVTVDGTKFNAVEVTFGMNTRKEQTGMPVLQSLATNVHVLADLGDDKNIPFDTIKKLFELSNVPDRAKLKAMKLEYWKDDTMQDVICSFSFKGWISNFKIHNPISDEYAEKFSHVMELELTPIINKESYQEVTIGN